MGFCRKRYFFLSICTLQILTVIERQAFDFLGFLWMPIFLNFFEIIFIILGFFGAYQFRPKYVLSYLAWNLLWLAWNTFLICLYLDLAGLDHKTNKILKLDPKSESWWRTEGPGCRRNFTSEADLWNGDAENCLLNYVSVEVAQAGIQCFLTILGVIIGACLCSSFLEEDDSSSRKVKNTKRTSLYSIEFSSQIENNQNDSDNDCDHFHHPHTSKPMTPRRVKRRSVMTRGSTARHSTSSRHTTGPRSSTRNSRRMVQNPVTKLLEQQQQQRTHPYDTLASPASLDTLAVPHYVGNGHANPTYQQSSSQSLNEDFDDLYNNRPSSVRSSYSNFHGARTLNYMGTKHYHSHATPQVPQKRNIGGTGRPPAFINTGPPAYSQSKIPVTIAVDSETAI